MFTLNFPIKLPDEHSFFNNGQYPVPRLPGGYSLACYDDEDTPLVLRISGFGTKQEALDFCPTLVAALRVAAIESEHSITPSDESPVISAEKLFNGSVPTVTCTQTNSLPYHMSSSGKSKLYISVFSKRIGAALAPEVLSRLKATAGLALSLELFSDCQFSGERNAQFIVLMTSLEVLVHKVSSKSKRPLVIALVKDALSKSGHHNPKSVGKILDGLYDVRNSLLHDGKAVLEAELQSLKEIVRSTLKALITNSLSKSEQNSE